MVELWPAASSPMAQMYLELSPRVSARACDALSRVSSFWSGWLMLKTAKVEITAVLIMKDIASEIALSIVL